MILLPLSAKHQVDKICFPINTAHLSRWFSSDVLLLLKKTFPVPHWMITATIVLKETRQVSLSGCGSEVRAPTHVFLSKVHEQSAQMLLLCCRKSSTEAAECLRATFRQKKQQLTTLSLGCRFSLKGFKFHHG